MDAIMAVLIYKLVCLLVGLSFGFMGFWLFKRGIWGNSGDLETQFKDTKFVLKAGAPGTFFALFGAAIIIATLLQGFSIKDIEHLGQDRHKIPTSPPKNNGS
jgi:hypothetical protein